MGEIGAWFDSRRGDFFSGIKLTGTDSFAILVVGVTLNRYVCRGDSRFKIQCKDNPNHSSPLISQSLFDIRKESHILSVAIVKAKIKQLPALVCFNKKC